MQSISAACRSTEPAVCSGVRVCKTHKRNAIHFGGIAVRGEDQRLWKASFMASLSLRHQGD
jgi:hypothetical protein